MKANRAQCLVAFALLFVDHRCVRGDDELEDSICFGTPTDTLLPHPTECRWYYVCDAGFGHKKSCPDNSLFDPVTRRCDSNYKCDNPKGTISTTSPTAPSHMPPSPLPSSSPSSSPTTSEPPSNQTIECPSNDTTDVTMLANPNNCSEYYLCYYGKAKRFECPRRYVFSASDRACIPIEQSTCDTELPHPPNPDGSNPECPKGIRRFYPHPKRCENFVYCENGARSIQRCQPFYHWDVTSERCKLRGRAICIENVPLAQRSAFY